MSNTEGLDPVQVRHLVNAGQWIAEQKGLALRRRRIRELVIHFLRTGRSDIDFRTWFIAYVDPTGETAVRNVLREKRQA